MTIIADIAAGHTQLLLWGGVLVAALLLGAAVLAKVNKWRAGMTRDEDSGSVLSAFQLSYEEGEISEEEYKRIRARVIGGKLAPPKDDKNPDAPQS